MTSISRERPIAFREVANGDYRCTHCRKRITDGMGTVAILGGEEVDGIYCSEAHAHEDVMQVLETVKESVTA